jgi:hypothetical protein
MSDARTPFAKALLNLRKPGTDPTVKAVCEAALSCVGKYSHGKGYAPSGVQYHNWSTTSSSTSSLEGLNCWTGLLFWAFQGGAIGHDWIVGYETAPRQVAGQMAKENYVMNSFLCANHVVDIAATDTPPPGVTVFFGDTGWDRPLNHVALSLGGGLLVSQQSLIVGVKGSIADRICAMNPNLDKTRLLMERLTHVSSIELIGLCNEDTPRIRCTTFPFWQLARKPWIPRLDLTGLTPASSY